MRGSSRSRDFREFRRSLRFLRTLGVERVDSFDSFTQLRDCHPESVKNEDAFQDSESSRGDLKHHSKRAGTPKVFVVERVLRGCQMPGVVTSDHVDEYDTKCPDVGFEGRVRNELAILIETLWNWLSESKKGGRGSRIHLGSNKRGFLDQSPSKTRLEKQVRNPRDTSSNSPRYKAHSLA